MSAIVDAIGRWNYQFLPPFALAGPDNVRVLAFAAIIAAAVLLSILLTWFVGAVKPGKLPRYGQTINTTAIVFVFFAAVFTSILSRATPFPPVYIVTAVLMYLAGTFALGTNYWIILEKSGGLAAPFFLQLRTFLWINVIMSSYFLVPPLLFQMPSFDRPGSTFFWGIPFVMAAAYAAYLYFVMPKALDLLGLRLEDGDLTQRQRAIIERFLEGGDKKDYTITVAARGLLNAMAFISRKKEIIIGVDLLDNLEEDEVRATLYHEEGHMQDRVFVKSMGRLALLFPAQVLLFSIYYATDLPRSDLPALVLFLLLFYLITLMLRRVKLRGELAADAYVKARGEEVYRSHLSGIEKLYGLAGMDRDICKRMNLAHLDLDERRDLLAEGGKGLPKRSVKRGVGSFLLWMLLGGLISILLINIPLTDSSRWSKAHDDFHDLMYTESGDEAIETIRRAVAIAEESFGPGSEKLSTSLTDLTEALVYYDHYDEALKVGARAVDVAERVYGEEDLESVRSLKNMGEIHYWREEYGPSREWFSRALEIQKGLDDDDADIVDTLEWISWTREDEGDYGKAVELHREMLEIYARDDEWAYEAAQASVRMGTFLALAGEKEEGDRTHRQALSEAKEKFGEQSETYVELLLEVAQALCGRGETQRAEQYFAKGLEILNALDDMEYLDEETIRGQVEACYREGQ